MFLNLKDNLMLQKYIKYKIISMYIYVQKKIIEKIREIVNEK